MLRLIPTALREAAVALGAPKWKSIVFVCYRAALDGIMTGVLLALARVAGETAPLLFTSLGNLNWSLSLNTRDEQPAGDHLPICRIRLQRVGRPGVGRRAADHLWRACHQHPGAPRVAQAELTEMPEPVTETTMEQATSEPGAGRHLASTAAASHEVLATPRISISDLNFFYGSNQALKSIVLNLPERQVTGMIGPSGCGKSTLPAGPEPDVRSLSGSARRGARDDGWR